LPRIQHAALEELQTAAERLSAGEVLSPALAEALLRGTSIGGARPKALLYDDLTGRRLIAKFEVASDPYPVVKAEAVAMDLARRVGLNVASTELIESRGKSVLLVDRFDRVPVAGGKVQRRMLVSALTLFGLDEMAARYATYHGLAEMIRRRFTRPEETLRELFGRIVFNICVSNTDDHARNHAAFYHFDPRGIDLTLTPGYDICPQPRSGETADQALAIDRDGRRASRLQLCVQAAPVYQLTAAEAREIIDDQVSTIEAEWADAADAARLTEVERARIWRQQILNPAIHYDL
jgi:serine/threonine-protein kinase HipA